MTINYSTLSKNLICLLVLFIVGCGYFKRKECEAVNWYDYGFKMAMKGQRLTGDRYVNECRKVDAEISESNLDKGFKAGMSNYCKEDVVYQTGKKGEALNTDLCDPSTVRNLLESHKKGVEQYCQPKNAFDVGTAGLVYTKICPAKLEPGFLVEYKKGRKKYLETVIVEKQSKIQILERKISDTRNEINRMEYEEKYAQLRLASIPASDINRAFERSSAQTDLDHATNRLQQTREQLSQENQEVETLQNQIFDHKREITALTDVAS